MAGQNPTRKQVIAHEIREYLLGLPPAKHSPLGANDDLVDELSLLEGIIQRLWKFVRFLQKLNPMEYLRWMHDAFARKVNELKSDESISTQYSSEDDIPMNDIELSEQAHKDNSKNTLHTKTKPSITSS
ncbi:MAG: hypothetical protein JSR17_11610 [Proteobacteria bacterium]|nr:hypothetical protein [Pseudomonadota bacterium]